MHINHYSYHSKTNCHTSISELVPGQAIERGDFGRHLIEQTLDADESVLASDIEHQLVQKFPFRPGMTAWFDRFQKPLDPAFAIGEGPAFLRVRAAGQQVM